MRPSFEKKLREYGRLAKEQMATEDAEELEGIQKVIDFQLGRDAMSQKVKKEKQKEVFDIQKEKQHLMERLYENLRCLDDENCMPERPPESRLVTYDENKNEFLVQMPNGTQEPATLGDVLTDGSWGLVYYLDPQSVSRMAQKKFFVESAKRELQDLLDEQITISERPTAFKSGEVGIYRQKQRVKGDLKKIPNDDSGHTRGIKGFVAEVAVKNFFQSLYYNSLTDFRIVDADVYQDAREAIDFIIHIEKHRRGVGVEVDDKISDVAVQFTTSKQSGKLAKVNKAKMELIRLGVVDDMVLIKFSMKDLASYYDSWLKEKKPPGGPFQYSSLERRKLLFERVIEKIPGDRDVLWQEIEPRLKFRE